MKDPLVTVIIPTYNNPNYLRPCLESLLMYRSAEGLFKIIVINNGEKNSCDYVQNKHVQVIDAGENLGWEGGLKLGLEHTDSEFVVFFNDDAFIPPTSIWWMNGLLEAFKDPKVGAVGPSSNVVMGNQNIFNVTPNVRFETKYLVFFCVMMRREALEKAGGVDDALQGGDDIDLSIRLRDAGYKLIINKNVFVYHHGFKTGERLHGASDKAFGWNSVGFTERTNFGLIKKHGLKKWYDTLYNNPVPELKGGTPDREGDIIRSCVKSTDKTIAELGCGGNKTLPNAIGVDIVPKGELVQTLKGSVKSEADITADVSKPVPELKGKCDVIIARHIIEHMIDPIRTLLAWKDMLKKGGRLVIATPDQNRVQSIPMNIEHLHAFTPDTMQVLLEAVGLEIEEMKDGENGVSFIAVGVNNG